jgi:hypothetical protein
MAAPVIATDDQPVPQRDPRMVAALLGLDGL